MGNKTLPIRQELNHPKVARRAEVMRKIEDRKAEMELRRRLYDEFAGDKDAKS